MREVLVLTLACLTYSVLSFLARASESVAVAHARDVVSTERSLGIDIESPVNSWLTTHPMLASLASMQYAMTFFLFTGLTLLALWVRSPQYYSRARWTLVVMTLGALITYWTYPLAPPRLVPEFGITDAVAQHTSAYSHLFGTLANPYGHAINAYGLVGLGSLHARNLRVALMVGASHRNFSSNFDHHDDYRNG